MIKTNLFKPFLVFFLAAVITIGLLPTKAIAEDATSVTTEAELITVFQNGGSAILESNITLTAPLVAASGKTITLDLNGYTIDRGLSTAVFNGNVVTVMGSLTINDSVGTGTITGGMREAYAGGGGVYVNGGTLTLNGGSITGNTTTGYGGGVMVASGTFDMYGGTISGNTTAGGGGGVCVTTACSFTLNAGEISGNTATKWGGGVYTDGGTFTMNNGTISNNLAVSQEVAEGYGGGVAVKFGGTFIMSGGQISGNTAEGCSTMPGEGGGVFVNMSGSFTMSGGVISKNKAKEGGGVYLDGSVYPVIGDISTFTLNGGEISENTTDPSLDSANGGGIYVIHGILNISNGSRIINNSAVAGGGIFMLGGTCTMENSEISGNITFGDLVCHGGGVFLQGGNFTMNSGIINGNKGVSGGGVYVSAGTFTMKDGQINENTTYAVFDLLCDGGGVYLNADGTFNMEGGEIRSNSVTAGLTTNRGGGIYVYHGALKISGAATITGNSRSGVDNNVYLKFDTDLIQVTGALTGTIGVSTGTGSGPVAVAQGSSYTISEDDRGRLTSDIAGGTFSLNDNIITLSGADSSLFKVLYFNSNGGSGSIASSSTLTGFSVTVAAGDGFSRANCSFAGWNTKADGSGIPYEPSASLTLNEDITLYAQWTINRAALSVTAPQGGVTPSSSATCVPSGVNVSLTWKKGEDSLTGSFDYNTVYSLEIALTAGSGCKFADTPEVTVNGATAAITSRSETALAATFTFDKSGPRSAPTTTLGQTTFSLANTGGTQSLTLNVAGIVEGYNPLTWTISKTDAGNILTLPSTTTGTLVNGSLALGDFLIAANAAGQPAKSATVTLTFAGNENGEYAGVPASLTVTFQLAAGSTPEVHLDFYNERINDVTDEMEYLVDESADNPSDWSGASPVTGSEILLSGIIPDAGSGSKYIHIRLRNIIGSIPTTIRIPARPDLTQILDWNSWVLNNIENDIEAGFVPGDFGYRINNGADMPGSSEPWLEIPLNPGDTLTFWLPATALQFKSAEISVTAPSRLDKPSVAIDFSSKKLNTSETIEYRLSTEDDWASCTENMAATDFGWDGTTPVSFQLRYPSTDEHYASEAQILTIPAYPSPPAISYSSSATSITVAAETGVRYRLDGGEWKTADENGKVIFTGLATNHSYTVDAQKTVTESSFQSEVVTRSVSTTDLSDGTGSVSMGSWIYGGTAAEPVPVSATNGTGSVTYAYAGTKADGTAYNSGTKPTDAGSYTVVATFAATGDYKQATSQAASFTISKKQIDVQWTERHYVYDGTEKTATWSITGLETGDAGNVSVIISSGQRVSAGFQSVTASLAGNRAFNYLLTNPVGTLTIQRAPVIFTVENNSIHHDGQAHVATITAVANGGSFEGFTVTYKQGGTVVPAPTNVGIYDIYASFNDANYRHFNGADGAEQKIGVLVIFDQAPAMYKTSFAPGEGTGAMEDLEGAVAGTVRILPNCGFIAGTPGYVFAGWKLDGKLYPAGASFQQPARDVSFTAQWVPSIHSVSGTVRRNGAAVEGSVLTLMRGSQQVGETVTDSQGRYHFTNVSPGMYNLTGNKDGVTMTILIEVRTTDLTGVDLALPLGKTNSVVQVLAGSPAIAVGNLEDIFERQDGVVFTPADQAAVDAGGTVEIKITAEVVSEDEEDSDQKKIADNAPGSNVGLYLEMRLSKSLTSGDGTVETPLSASNTLLEIVVPLPPELQGKDSYIVYRCHGDELHTLTAEPNNNGEYMTVNSDKTSITIHAMLFSTYAIGYIVPASPGGGDNPSGPSSDDIPVTVEVRGLPYYLDAGGSKVFIGFSSDASGHMKYIAPEGTTVLFSENLKSFTDIQNHWAKTSIDFITQREIFQGTGGGIFSPDTGMTRGMLAAVLGRLYERSFGLLKSSDASSFADVAADAYYAAYVVWAEKSDIFKGVGGGRFDPNRQISREEMAVLLYRFASFLKVSDTEISGVKLSYSDASEISSWAIDGVKYCQEAKLMTGCGNGNFEPKETVTRAEVATILERFIQAVVLKR